MPSSHLILCHPLLLLPPIPPSIRVFSNESTHRMRWPKYWSFSFSIIPSKEIPGLISFRMFSGKESTRDVVSIPGLGISPGEGTENPLQYSCLGNPIDKRAWQATVRGVAKRQTHVSIWAHDYLSRQGSLGIQTPWIPLLEIVSHPLPSFLALVASHPQPYCLGVFLAATCLKSPLYSCLLQTSDLLPTQSPRHGVSEAPVYSLAISRAWTLSSQASPRSSHTQSLSLGPQPSSKPQTGT